MVELAQELFLVHDRVHGALRDYTSLRHFFHSEKLLFLSEFNFPDFAEAAPSDDVLKIEVVLIDLCNIDIN